MKKILIALGMVMLWSTTSEYSYGASAKCEVVTQEKERLVIACTKNTKDFPKGTKIKIKSVKRKPIEGC